MPTPDPKPGKSKKKKSKSAAPSWPNYAGSERLLPVAKLPLMGEAEKDIAASYERLVAHLGGLPDDKARLACCESMFGRLVGNLQIGPTKNLKAGIILAMVAKADWHLSRPNEHKDPLYKKKFTQYQTELLHQCNLGKSSSQVSRMRRAGDLFIRLVEAKQPVPDTAERLIRLLPLKGNAVATYIQLAKEAGNRVPTPEKIGELMRSERKLKDAKPEAKVAKLKAACDKLLTLLEGQAPSVLAVRDAIQRLLEDLKVPEVPLGIPSIEGNAAPQDSGNTSAEKAAEGAPAARVGNGGEQGAAQKSTVDQPEVSAPQVKSVPAQPAASAAVAPAGALPASAKADFSKDAWGYRLERYGRELRVSVLDKEISQAAHYYQLHLPMPTDPAWKRVVGKRSMGLFQKGPPVWTRFCQSENEAYAGFRETLAILNRIKYQPPAHPRPEAKS